MTPGRIDLPPGYDFTAALRYHGRDWFRDPAAPAEQVRDGALCKAVLLAGRPHLLTLTPLAGRAAVDVTVDSDDAAVRAAGLDMARHMLGLTPALDAATTGLAARAAAGDADFVRLIADRAGFRPPLAASVFEALTWAIIGQQINLTFAADLRRQLILLAGRRHPGGMIAHPDAADVAALAPEQLTARRFSRAKAGYLLTAARAVAEGALDLDRLATLAEADAESALLALRGVGPWTANYVLLRGCGLVDRVPVGDAGLAAALQRFHALDHRPPAAEQAELMRPFAPWRGLATAYLWACWT